MRVRVRKASCEDKYYIQLVLCLYGGRPGNYVIKKGRKKKKKAPCVIYKNSSMSHPFASISRAHQISLVHINKSKIKNTKKKKK